MNVRGVEQPVVVGLYADDTVLLGESEVLQRIVDEFDRVCKRTKLKVNAGKSKVMGFKRARKQTIKVTGVLERVMKGRNVNMAVKRE